jgi:hypothetical protein
VVGWDCRSLDGRVEREFVDVGVVGGSPEVLLGKLL